MKIVQKIINVISIALIVLSVLALVTVVLTPKGQAPNFFGFSFFRVSSPSMTPTYPVDTMIIVKRTAIEDVKENDVISFYSTDPDISGQVNTHRVYSIESQNGTIVITTKGDANLAPDKYTVKETQLIGVVVGQSKALGVIQRLASNPLIFIPLIVLPLLFILITNLLKTIKSAKTLAKEEELAAQKELLELLEKNEELKRKKQEEAQAAENLESEDTVQAEMQAAREELEKAKSELEELKKQAEESSN